MIPPRFTEEVYALFRIVFAVLFIMHGLQKLVGMFGGLGGHPAPVGSQLWVASIIECTTGALILLGLFTRYAAFLASGLMAVAYFTAHQPNGGVPLQNMGEPAVMNCFAFLYIAARGSGRYSLDAMWRRSEPIAAPTAV